jgi:nucleotide-binding universal stress UspA family protein
VTTTTNDRPAATVTGRPFDQILVPLDGSPAAERALGPALALARRAGVPLRLLSRALPDQDEELAGYLADLTDRHAAVTDVETQVLDMEAIPAAIARGLDPGTLVCMASHGRARSEALVGSVTEATLRTIGAPVLVVGPHVPADVSLAAGWVVACLDGSELSERALAPAQAWSSLLGARLCLAQVLQLDVHGVATTPGDVVEAGYLASVAHRLGGIERWEVLHHNDAASGLAALSTDPSVRLLVTATHGRTGWSRLRLGSVTAATIRRSQVPTLVVPAAAASDEGTR